MCATAPPEGRAKFRLSHRHLHRLIVSADENLLIESLPSHDKSRLLALCEHHDLIAGDVLCQPGEEMRHVYFPLAGTVSLIASTIDGQGLEVGIVGREGMLGAQFIFASPVPTLRATARGAGAARRVEAGAFNAELARSPALQLGLSRCLAVLMGQLSASAACLHFHTVRARLARWMLLALDRTSGANLSITHKELGRLLGVRRVSITDAACVLQRLGLIEYKRGTLSVTDRSGLEMAACCCYESDRRAYVESLK